MVDYTESISGSSTMMIRDTGTDVEFWFKTGPSSWNNDQRWSYYANGSGSGTREIRLLQGGNWQKFGEVRVTYDQTVSWTIYDAGIGFPTHTFDHFINRASVPPAPNLLEATAISSSTVHVRFSSRGDGGSPVVEWEIGYGTSSSGPQHTINSNGTSDIGGFSSGQKIYFWARGRNSKGWSAWSNRRDATTWRTPIVSAPAVSKLEQVSMHVYIYDKTNGGTATLEREVGYGLDPTTPTDTVPTVSGHGDISGLDPGKTYYLWGRARNAVGWGPWSERTMVTTVAGARVLVGSTWKRAVPYVRSGGVWKLARPWVKSAGTWKETII